MTQQSTIQQILASKNLQYGTPDPASPYEAMLSNFIEESALIEDEARRQNSVLMQDNIALHDRI